MVVEVKLAPPEFADWAGLLALLHAAFAYQHDRIDPPSSLHALNAELLAEKAMSEHLLIAVEGDALIACAFAKPQPGHLYIGKVAVSPHRQGEGIGRLLMQAAQELALQKGLAALELETRIELHENHRTFAALGFARIAENAHAGYNRTTSIRMRKRLTAGAV